MNRAPIVIVVSIPKSGTHLIGELMVALGYQVYSQPGGFGTPMTQPVADLVMHDPASLPPNTCAVIHELPLGALRDDVILRWQETGVPAILFNYRDPRAVICSSLRFLLGQTYSGWLAPRAPWLVHSAILKNLSDRGTQFRHAMRNPSFPYYRAFRDSSWLYLHPQACNVRFEDLVGAAGGGSDERQQRQVAAILRHLGVPGDPRQFAQRIYKRDAPVFSKGRIDSWKEELTGANLEEFETRFADVLDLYGYPPATAQRSPAVGPAAGGSVTAAAYSA